MSNSAELSATQVGAYLVKGTIGNVGLPGAPVAYFSLVVVPGAHSVSGVVEIKQSVTPPGGNITVQVTGAVRATGYGKVTQIVALQGQYSVPFPPPAIGELEQKFTAHLAIDGAWNGTGGFTYGGQSVENVPVTKLA